MLVSDGTSHGVSAPRCQRSPARRSVPESPSRPNRSITGMVQRVSPSRPNRPVYNPTTWATRSKSSIVRDGGEAATRITRIRSKNGEILERLLFGMGFVCIALFFITYETEVNHDDEYVYEYLDADPDAYTDSYGEMPTVIPEVQDTFHPHWDGKRCERSSLGEGALPSIVVLGVHKGGTTALFSYLAAHGGIRPSYCKETHFLDWRYTAMVREQQAAGDGLPTPERLRAEYRRFFRPESERPGTVALEATPSYFFGGSGVASRARDVVPDARLVVSLRNPIDRTISHFMGRSKYREGSDEPNCSTWFRRSSQAIASRCDDLRPRNQGFVGMTNISDNGSKIAQAWALYTECILSTKQEDEPVARSIYAPQLYHWLQHFPKEQMYLMQSEALFYHTGAEMDRLMNWLGMRSHMAHERKNFVPIGSSHMKRFNWQIATRQVGQAKAMFAAHFDCNKKEMNQFYSKYEDDLWDVLTEFFPKVAVGWSRWSQQKGDKIIPPSHLVHGHSRKYSQVVSHTDRTRSDAR